MNHNSPQFKKLQDEWYKKLQDSGFDDIEHEDGKLRTGPNNNFESQVINASMHVEAKTEYFRQAGFFLHDHKFQDDFDRLVWGLHTRGLSVREIVKALKFNGISTYRREVDEKIRELKNIMILKIKQEVRDENE